MRLILLIYLILAGAILLFYSPPFKALGLFSTILYWFLPGAVIAGSAIALVLNKSWRLALLISITTGILALPAAEIYVRSQQRLVPTVADDIFAEVLRDRAAGKNTVTAFSPSELIEPQGTLSALFPIAPGSTETLPLTGPSNSPLVVCKEDGYLLKTQSDDSGFHNPGIDWQEQPVDIALIGDSFAFGYCVPPEAGLAEQLRKNFPNVVNFGVGGIGPLVELAILREYASASRPKKVIWAYFENDMENLGIEGKSPILRKYLSAGFSQGLRARTAELDDRLRRFFEARLSSRTVATRAPSLADHALGYVLLQGLRGVVHRADSHSAADIPLFRQIMKQAKDDVGQWGGEIIFVYLPSWAHFDPKLQAFSAARRRNREDVLTTVTELNIKIVDLYQPFEKAADRDALFRGFGLHYTPRGYELAGEVIARELGTKK